MNKLQREFILVILLVVGMFLTMFIGMEAGKALYPNDMYGELKPLFITIISMSLYSSVILFLILGKIEKK